MSKPSYEFESFDFDAVWAALSKSTQLRNYIGSICTQVYNEAVAKAKNEAYDEGYYSSLFRYKISSGAEIRREFQNTKEKRRNRARRGTINRLIDQPIGPQLQGESGKPVKIKGDPDGSSYIGSVGLVENTDFKAVWVEYGSIAKGPRFILSRSAEEVANRTDNEWEVLYAKTHQQNIPELKAKQAEGKAKIANVRDIKKTGSV